MLRRFIISLFLLLAAAYSARAVDPYNLVVPTGIGVLDTGNIVGAFNGCTNIKGVFLAPGTFKVTGPLAPPDGCTVTGSLVGSPTASANGTQNTVIDCSGLSGTQACFRLSYNSDLLTGFKIIGNGSTAFTNTTCIDNESQGGGHQILHMVLSNCGVGINIGSGFCCTQNDRIIGVAFQNNGISLFCHTNCTDAYFADLMILSPGAAGVWCALGCYGTQWDRISIQNNPATGVGLNFSSGQHTTINVASVDGGSCLLLGNSSFTVSANGVRCAGDGGANEYCLSLGNSFSGITGLQCTGGYNGTGSSVLKGTLSNTCSPLPADGSSCEIDVMWNGTDPLYNTTASQTTIDRARLTRAVGYVPVTLTGSTFAAPDPSKGFSQSFAITASCPCTLPAPVVMLNGQGSKGGYFAFTQPATPVTNPITWNAAYQNTAQPLATGGKTTWFPWVARNDSAAIVLGTSFHN